MPKKKNTILADEAKVSFEGWMGGLPIDLDAKMKLGDNKGKSVREVLSSHFLEELNTAIKNQEKLNDKIPIWNKIYEGVKEKKSFPYPGCFSEDTDVLTNIGWKPVSNIEVGDELLSVNPKTGESSYQPVISTIQRKEEKLVHITSDRKTVDLLVTHDHNVAVREQGSNKIRFVSAGKFLKTKTGKRIPLTSKWTAENAEDICGENANLFMEFLGWFIAEGWVFNSKTIGIAQIKSEGRQRIKFILDALGYRYSEKKFGFLVSSRNFTDTFIGKLKSLGKCHEKYIPREYMGLGTENLRNLLNGLVGGDGNVRNVGGKDIITYYTTSSRLADDVQEIAQKVGLRAKIKQDNNIGRIVAIPDNPGVSKKQGYIVSILNRDNFKLVNATVKEVDYGGIVYCFTLKGFNTVYVRRNGTACWCGQCSNMAVPYTRSCIDTAFVRYNDSLFNKKTIATVTSRNSKFDEKFVKDFENGFDWVLKHIVKFVDKIASPLLQSNKIGTGIVKIVYEKIQRTRYRYATQQETTPPPEQLGVENTEPTPAPKKPGTSQIIKETISVYDGPNVYPIDRSDFIISSDATTIDDAYMCGFRTRYRKSELELKSKILDPITGEPFFDPDAVEALTNPDEMDKNKKARIESQLKGTKLTKYASPFEVWELWSSFDVDEDGQEDSIVITMHKNGLILNAIYNPFFTGFKPFEHLPFLPKEFSFDGEGACKILEPIQVGIDTLENQRLDRLTQINAPIYLVRTGAGLEDFNQITPGKIYRVDDIPDDVIKELSFGSNFYPTFQEESMLEEYGRQAIGITPASMGISTAERPVAKAELQNLQESNKKFLYQIGTYRKAFGRIFWKIIDVMAQYSPTYTYTDENLQQQEITFPPLYLRDGLNIELAASSELMDSETRREVKLTEYQLMKDYNTNLAQMLQGIIAPQTPPDFKQFLIDMSVANGEILIEILREFEELQPEKRIVLLSKYIKPEDIQPPPPPPQQGPPQGGPQGGPPGQGGPQGPGGPPQGPGGPPQGPPMGPGGPQGPMPPMPPQMMGR